MNINFENQLDRQEIIIGKLALNLLASNQYAKIWGITSGGVFLHLDPSIIFVTIDKHRGPVNLIMNHPIPSQWKKEEEITFSVNDQLIKLIHQKAPLELIVKEIWQTPPKPIPNITSPEQQERITAAASQLSLLKKDQGFAPLLAPFISDSVALETDNSWLFSSWNTINLLRIALLQQDSETFFLMANLLVGSGRGLTPSGDDLLTGFTFMRRRWFPEAEWMTETEDQLFSTFKEKTTAVSSTLYDCALQGEVDARIQEMSDSLMNGDIPFHNQALQLSRWGNSSGADIFLGMLLAIRCFLVFP
jgi:hypothetical protein